MIDYTCRYCGAQLSTDDALGMKEEACPICSKMNVVPPTKEQKAAQKEELKSAKRAEQEKLRQKQEQQRQEQNARDAEAQRVQKQQEFKKAREYSEAIALAKANPETPKIWYCCLKDGTERGPMQESILQKWIDDGQVTPDSVIRTQDGTVWFTVRDIPERFHFPIQQANVVRCPKCQSSQIATNKKGMDVNNACCGALLFGPLGLLCGMTKSDRVIITCLNCGYQWTKG